MNEVYKKCGVLEQSIFESLLTHKHNMHTGPHAAAHRRRQAAAADDKPSRCRLAEPLPSVGSTRWRQILLTVAATPTVRRRRRRRAETHPCCAAHHCTLQPARGPQAARRQAELPPLVVGAGHHAEPQPSCCPAGAALSRRRHVESPPPPRLQAAAAAEQRLLPTAAACVRGPMALIDGGGLDDGKERLARATAVAAALRSAASLRSVSPSTEGGGGEGALKKEREAVAPKCSAQWLWSSTIYGGAKWSIWNTFNTLHMMRIPAVQ